MVADVLGVARPATPTRIFGTTCPDCPASRRRSRPRSSVPTPRTPSTYRAGLRRFDASLAPLDRVVAKLRGAFAGQPVAYTEPVPGYLLQAAGLVNLAPAAFTRSIEDGTEPSPASVAEMLQLFSAHKVRVLLYNDQTVSPITIRVRTAARAAGIPVVGVSETLPPQRSFQRWQLAQAQALDAALSQ